MIEKFSKNIVWIVVVAIIFVGAFYIIAKNSEKNPEANYPDGLDVEVLQEGSGDPIVVGNLATVHYTGTLDDGTVFDSSVTRGTPFEFTVGVGQVIQGWDLGVVGMRIGEKRRLTIAPELAYGSVKRGPIPPNSRLTFEVELVGIR